MLIRKPIPHDTPTALVRSAAQGYIGLQGTAELMAGDPIYAPLSNRIYTWYRYPVEEKHRRHSGSGSKIEWRTVNRGTSDSLFYPVDTTGRCAVDPEGANVTSSSHDVRYGNSRIPGRFDIAKRWLRYTGISQMGRRYRYTEERIELGDRLYAWGDFKTRGGAAAAFDRSADIRELLRQLKRNEAAMRARFDTDNDGEIDRHEWAGARREAAQEVDKKRSQVAVAPPVDVLGCSRGSRNPFILAARTEAEMLAQFHWSTVGLSAAAFVVGVTVLWMLSMR